MKGYSFTELAKLVEAAMPRAGGAFSGNVSAPKFLGPLQGNADTATVAGRADKLSTARNITIGSTTKAFDGTGNLSWSLAEIGAINASATVAAAHKWATPRALQIGNSSKAVDGSTNVAWSLAEIGAVNKAGDTITGALSSTSTISATQFYATSNGAGTNVQIGDDAWFGDVNLPNTTRLMGVQDSTKGYLIFGNGDSKALGRSGTGALTYDGYTVWHSGNDGSSSGLDADLLDGLDSTRFSRSAVGQLNNYDNWDAFTAHGTYKVHCPDFAGSANAPPSTYGYGILQVEVSEIGGENRTNQVYYPHNNDYDKYIYQRMLNGGIWTAWSKIWRGGTDSGSGLVAERSRQAEDTAPIGDGRDLIYGRMGGYDFFRLRIYSDVYDNGQVELATADGGNEPIYVRQYDGIFSSVRRTLALLDGNGNTVLPGVLYATGHDIGAGGGGIWQGNGDGANSQQNNVKLTSWYGIGFGPSISGQPVPYGEYSHWFNTRTGDVGCRGRIWAGNGYLHSVTVLTGDIWHGNWLPIPAGYDESQCRFFISPRATNPNENAWDLREGLNTQHYSEYCYLQNTRQVIMQTRVYNDINDSFQYHDGSVNYIVIGVK